MAHIEDRWKRTGRDAGRRWRVRYLDPSGRERNRSFDRKIDAERFRVRVEADLLRGTYMDPDAGKKSFRIYANEWAKGYHADSGQLAKVRNFLDGHILPQFGDMTLAQVASRPSAITQWVTGLPLSARTAGQVLGTLSSVLSAAVADGLIVRNPCKDGTVRAPRPARRVIVPWTGAQLAIVRAALPEPWRAVADCGGGLGLRQGEIFGIGPDEVDFLRRVVHVRRQVKRLGGKSWFGPPKGGRERDIPLASPVALALSAQIAAFPPRSVTLPWHEPANAKRHGQPAAAALLFTGRDGAALIASTFNTAAWLPAVAAAGIEHDQHRDGMHAMRHFFASAMLSGGVDIRALSEYLGHHDPGFTLRIYAHLMPDADQRALRALETALAEQDHGPDTAQGGANQC